MSKKEEFYNLCLHLSVQTWRFVVLLVFVSLTYVVGCATVATKDFIALQNAIDLKVESLALLDKAGDVPDIHKEEIQNLRLKMLKALEYEKTRGELNSVTIQQWELLIDPNGHLLGGFLKKWEADGVGRSQAFLNGVKHTVAKAFDQIIKVETNKPTRAVL